MSRWKSHVLPFLYSLDQNDTEVLTDSHMYGFIILLHPIFSAGVYIRSKKQDLSISCYFVYISKFIIHIYWLIYAFFSSFVFCIFSIYESLLIWNVLHFLLNVACFLIVFCFYIIFSISFYLLSHIILFVLFFFLFIMSSELFILYFF